MAARRDEWLSRAEAKRPEDVAELLASLRDTSVPKLEQRLLALTHFPATSAIGEAAAAFLNDFPLKQAENLTLAAVAVGLVVLHGAKTLRRDVPVPERLAPWRAQVVDALLKTLARPSKTTPGDLDARLAVLGDGPGTQITRKAAELIDVARDARIAQAAATLLERPPVKFDAANAYFTVAALLLVVHGGRAQRKTVTALGSKLVQLTWLERALADDDAPASVKKVSGEHEDDFLELIAEDPRDASRIAVFTDWLLERGDPRGDFNVQQRAGKSGASLQKKHEKQWLRSLARGARRGSTVFRDGVPREVFLYLQRAADVPLADDPVLATLESLEVVASLPVEPLLTSPRLKSLTTLVATPEHLALAPAALRDRLTTLGIRGEARRALEVLALAPNATTLRLVENWRTPLARDAVPPRLTHLDVQTSAPAAWFPLAARVARLDVRPAYWRESEDGRRRVQFHFENGRLARIACDDVPDALALDVFLFAPLASLAPEHRRGVVSHVTFTPSQKKRFLELCG